MSPVALAQEDELRLPIEDAERRASAIAASIVPPDEATSDIRRLAGEYSYGNSFDDNSSLQITADGKFTYTRSTYEGVIDQVRGSLKLEDERLVLNPDDNRKKWPRGTASVLVPISWGQRLYLIPDNDIAGFSNEVNRGTEPVTRGSMGNYFLREGDWDRPVAGKPDLPGEWQERLLDEPVTGLIAGRDPSNRWIINLGKDYGVYDGMELSAWSKDRRNFVTLIVTETGRDTSAVQLVGAPPNLSVTGWTVHSRIAPPAEPTSQMQSAVAQVPGSQATPARPQVQTQPQLQAGSPPQQLQGAPMPYPALIQPTPYSQATMYSVNGQPIYCVPLSIVPMQVQSTPFMHALTPVAGQPHPEMAGQSAVPVLQTK